MDTTKVIKIGGRRGHRGHLLKECGEDIPVIKEYERHLNVSPVSPNDTPIRVGAMNNGASGSFSGDKCVSGSVPHESDPFWSLVHAIGASQLEADLIWWGLENAPEPINAIRGRFLDDTWIKRCLGAVARRRISLADGWEPSIYPDWPAMQPYANAMPPTGDLAGVAVENYDRATLAVLDHLGIGERHEERAAIREYDGGQGRADAERGAMAEITDTSQFPPAPDGWDRGRWLDRIEYLATSCATINPAQSEYLRCEIKRLTTGI